MNTARTAYDSFQVPDSDLATCKRCGDTSVHWQLSARTGKHYLVQVTNGYTSRNRFHNCDPDKLQPEPPAVTLDTAKLISFFAQAATHLDQPSIRAVLEVNGREYHIMVKLASPSGLHAGKIWITNATTKRVWGCIQKNGKLDNYVKNQEISEAMVSALTVIAMMPAQAAYTYAKLTGRCCYCALKLDDARSTEVGYGQKCAKNWGLPWGSADKRDTVLKELQQVVEVAQETPDWRPAELMPEDYYSY